MAYDRKVRELVDYFFAKVKGATAEDANELSARLQDEIEGFIQAINESEAERAQYWKAK